MPINFSIQLIMELKDKQYAKIAYHHARHATHLLVAVLVYSLHKIHIKYFTKANDFKTVLPEFNFNKVF